MSRNAVQRKSAVPNLHVPLRRPALVSLPGSESSLSPANWIDDLSIVGESEGLRRVIGQVERVSRTDAPVLILGETGSGKELIARLIHSRSPRARGPVLRVNCGAIPAELIDSELFGHEKGSFTGAGALRKGWFERAHGGTLFLDEVGELPPAAQVRLLRVLQDGTFERVGGQRTLRCDVRIVAATHRDLSDMVASGQFRQDLWYRINVFPVRLPPLRERMDDLPALTRHFAASAGSRLGNPGLRPLPDDLARLAGYSWPGNIRELAAVIERAAILGNGLRLDIAGALSAQATSPAWPAPARSESRVDHALTLVPGGASPTPASTGGTAAVADSLDDVVVTHIKRVLAETRGRIEGRGGAADRLNVNPHTLRARMKKLGIDWSSYRH